MSIVFSIVMPTYNSEGTIRYSLESISAQKYDLTKTECLIVDGGSDDRTIEIATEYPFVRILNNEKRLPEYAKQIGFEEAVGKFVVFMDSDEAFSDDRALALREKAFYEFPKAHLLVADRLLCDKSLKLGIAGNYINNCGDPFTYFIYKPRESISKTYAKQIVQKTSKRIVLFDFKSTPKRPIADGGTKTIDSEYIKREFSEELKNSNFIVSVSDRIFNTSGYCLCIENDDVIHRSKSDLKSYLKKIRFRIINNVFNKEESGFSTRSISNGHKKYLFPFYTASVVFPLWDSIKLSFVYKDLSMMLHIFYCYYTCFYIATSMLLKAANGKKTNKEY